MKVDLVVEIGDDAGVIWNNSNSLSQFGFAHRVSEVDDAVFFVQTGDGRIRIVWQEPITVAFPGGNRSLGERLAACVDDRALRGGPTNDRGQNC